MGHRLENVVGRLESSWGFVEGAEVLRQVAGSHKNSVSNGPTYPILEVYGPKAIP